MKPFDPEAISSFVRGQLLIKGNSLAKILEEYAKTERPWTDRTGNARNSIIGEAHQQEESVSIILSGNVDYFEFLEFYHEQKWAILYPTIEKYHPEMLSLWADFLDKLEVYL